MILRSLHSATTDASDRVLPRNPRRAKSKSFEPHFGELTKPALVLACSRTPESL